MFYNYVKSPEAIRNSIRNVPNGISFFCYSSGYISFEIPLSPMRFLTIEKWRWIPQLPLWKSLHAPKQGTSENLGSFTGSWLLKSTWQKEVGRTTFHGLCRTGRTWAGWRRWRRCPFTRFTWPTKSHPKLRSPKRLKHVDPYLAQSTKKRIIKTENDDVCVCFQKKQRMIKYPKWPLGWYHLISGFPTRFSKLGSASL